MTPTAHRTKTATDVRAAWASVLGHRTFGDTSGFFDAGGDSLGLIGILGILRADHRHLRLVHLMKPPTVADFAGFLTAGPASPRARSGASGLRS
jgi:aryl carrier-like protein